MVTSLREFDGAQFDYVCTIELEREESGVFREHMPQERYAKRDEVPLNRYGSGPFGKFKIPRNFKVPGVYALTIDGALKYVGEAANLSARYNAGYGNISPKNCYKGGQETNCRLNNLIYGAVSQGAIVELWFHPTDGYKALEIELRANLKPEWNRI